MSAVAERVAGASVGFFSSASDFRQVGHMIVEVLDGLATSGEAGNAPVEARVKQAVMQLCARFPIYA